MRHLHRLRVYYEDTDFAGIVYYANYFKFIERARTEMLRAAGIDQIKLRSESGIVFAVRRVEADFLRSAKFDDLLGVLTTTTEISGARLVLRQTVQREGEILFEATAVLVCVGESGKPTRIPIAIRRAMVKNDSID